jgi:hypothetical protein
LRRLSGEEELQKKEEIVEPVSKVRSKSRSINHNTKKGTRRKI